MTIVRYLAKRFFPRPAKKTDRKPHLENERRLRELLHGHRYTALTYLAVRLGVPDQLSSCPLSEEVLSTRLQLNPKVLRRLMRAWIVLGLFCKKGEAFGLTSMGRLLTSEGKGFREGALLAGEEFSQAWTGLGSCLHSGKSAFEHVFGMSQWDHRRANPEIAECFNVWMRGLTDSVIPSILDAHDFSAYETMADVGGGRGGLMAAVLGRYPHLRGILFDQPAGLVGAEILLAEAGVANRCEIRSGDFSQPMTFEADAVVLKSVLHNCPDRMAIALLESCRQSMKSGGELLVIERIMPDDPEKEPGTVFLDIQMMAMTGGMERTGKDFYSLFRESGLCLRETVALANSMHLMILQKNPRE